MTTPAERYYEERFTVELDRRSWLLIQEALDGLARRYRDRRRLEEGFGWAPGVKELSDALAECKRIAKELPR